jgi:hypothetical protein
LWHFAGSIWADVKERSDTDGRTPDQTFRRTGSHWRPEPSGPCGSPPDGRYSLWR